MSEKIIVEMSKHEFELLTQLAEVGYYGAGLVAREAKDYSIHMILGIVGSSILAKAKDYKVIEEKDG